MKTRLGQQEVEFSSSCQWLYHFHMSLRRENLFYDGVHSSLILTNNFSAQEIVQNAQVTVLFLVWGFYFVGIGVFFSLARAHI